MRSKKPPFWLLMFFYEQFYNNLVYFADFSFNDFIIFGDALHLELMASQIGTLLGFVLTINYESENRSGGA